MELESIGFTKERAKEMVNVAYLMRKLVKKPKRPLDNVRLRTTVILILIIVVLAFLMFFGLVWRDSLFIFGAGLYLAATLIYSSRIFHMIKMEKNYLSLSRDRKTVLDEEGVSLTVNGESSMKFYWNTFSVMRVFEHNIVCIPKDIKNLSMSFPIEDLEKIRQYIEEHNIDLEIC